MNTPPIKPTSPHVCGILPFERIVDNSTPDVYRVAFVRKSTCGFVLGVVYFDRDADAWIWRTPLRDGRSETGMDACTALDRALEKEGHGVLPDLRDIACDRGRTLDFELAGEKVLR